jgi:mitochondrial fission protein ELM1
MRIASSVSSKPSVRGDTGARVWVLIDRTQEERIPHIQGLLETMGLSWKILWISRTFRLYWLLRWFWRPRRFIFGGALSAPWPAFLMGVGPLGCLAASLLKRASGAFALGFLPGREVSGLDWIIQLKKGNKSKGQVQEIFSLPHTTTLEKIKYATTVKASRFSALPHLRIGVFVYDTPGKTLWTGDALSKMIQALKELIEKTGGGVMIVLSSGVPASVRGQIKSGLPRGKIYLQSARTSYLPVLGESDYILVTRGSSRFLCEAAVTDAPIYICPFPAFQSSEFSLLERRFIQRGLARPFFGELDFWLRDSHNPTNFVASQLSKKLPHVSD